MIYNSNDQRRFANTMECDHRGKGEEKIGKRNDGKKGQFWDVSYFWTEYFLNEVLGLLENEETNFMLNDLLS